MIGETTTHIQHLQVRILHKTSIIKWMYNFIHAQIATNN